MVLVTFPLPGSIPESYFSIFTLGSCQHQPRVGHVIPQIHVGATAQDLAPLLQWDVGFYGDSVGTNHRPVRSSLALDFSTLGIPDGNKHTQRTGEAFPSPLPAALLYFQGGFTWVHIWQRSSWSLSRSCRKGLRQN